MRKQITAYKLQLLSSNDINICNTTSQITDNRLDNLLYWLSEQPGDKLKVVWDIDEFTAPLLRLCPKHVIERLAKRGVAEWRHFKIRYIKEKLIMVRFRERTPAIYYNLSRWYPDIDAGEPPDDLQELSDALLETLYQMGYVPNKLTSPVAMYEDCIMSGMSLPIARDHYNVEDWQAARYANRCINRAWREVYQLGYFEDTVDWDIESAYGTVTHGLLDTRYIKWVHSTKFIKEACYGYLAVRLEMDADVHPIIYRNKETNRLSTPNGEWYTYITKEEYQHIVDYELGIVEIQDGWYGIPQSIVYPWANAFDTLYKYKYSNDPLIRSTAKQIMASVWGKFRELHEHRPGMYFNAFWGAQCETLPRLEVHRHIIRNSLERLLICTTVDGCVVENDGRGRGEYKHKSDNGFTWKMSYVGPTLALSSYNTWYGDKRPESMTLRDVMGMIWESPNALDYKRQLTRRVTMKEALEHNDISLVGIEREFYTGFSMLGQEYERHYPHRPMTGGDLLENTYLSGPKYMEG